jgi:hypothetical protein
MCSTWVMGPILAYLMVSFYYLGGSGFWEVFVGNNPITFILILFVLYIAHELLHVLAGVMLGASLNSFDFGFDKSTLSIECACSNEMSVLDYKIILLSPFLLLTPLLFVLACCNESHVWWQLLTISTTGCSFDLTVFMGLMGIPNDTKIVPMLKGENGFVFVQAAA